MRILYLKVMAPPGVDAPSEAGGFWYPSLPHVTSSSMVSLPFLNEPSTAFRFIIPIRARDEETKGLVT